LRFVLQSRSNQKQSESAWS